MECIATPHNALPLPIFRPFRISGFVAQQALANLSACFASLKSIRRGNVNYTNVHIHTLLKYFALPVKPWVN